MAVNKHKTQSTKNTLRFYILGIKRDFFEYLISTDLANQGGANHGKHAKNDNRYN